MKQRESLLYYPVSENKLLVNTAAFKQLKSHIEYAVITHYQGAYLLERVCSRKQRDPLWIVQNGQTVDAKYICTQCVNRLKWVTGKACSDLMFIKKEKYDDFSYLTSLLVQKNARIDMELAIYVTMHTTTYMDSEQGIDGMTYDDYRSLLSFFTKLSVRLEQLHRLRRFLRKFFR